MNGLILLDKPAGSTSFKAAACIRRIYGEKRVGHTGTLDPLATGVLPILVGRATRLCSYVLEADKRYAATVRLGITTDSLDITGEVLSEREVNVTDVALKTALEHFTGTYDQIPPMFSAIKKDGVRLYDLARKGVEVERQPRRVTIKELNLIERNGDEFKVDVLCSKGTYIRSLADDIGRSLGCGACLTALRRTKTAQFEIEQCVTLEELEKAPEKHLLSPEKAVEYLRCVEYSAAQGARFKNGAEIDAARIAFFADVADGELLRVRCDGVFLGLAAYSAENNSLKTKCVIAD